jgi:hypothetical protein
MSIASELKKLNTEERQQAVRDLATPLEALLRIGNYRQKKQAAALLTDLQKSL